ncbi:Ras GTPase domain-containing protein [Tieghemostelium lacteum]|uniref:Ras GTPase domain-containing protein n=1 Tax=Tieghemostelium lacteum TaxID=361077 RepID=A0A152A8I8_TIELA|nr:Ras GTPase domain-containing protein [Tieghemostelium lacteum]|eukprot:KYR02569.1 Ras GTPase domain-containing protein [Tieghemostelium lacteum]
MDYSNNNNNSFDFTISEISNKDFEISADIVNEDEGLLNNQNRDRSKTIVLIDNSVTVEDTFQTPDTSISTTAKDDIKVILDSIPIESDSTAVAISSDISKFSSDTEPNEKPFKTINTTESTIFPKKKEVVKNDKKLNLLKQVKEYENNRRKELNVINEIVNNNKDDSSKYRVNFLSESQVNCNFKIILNWNKFPIEIIDASTSKLLWVPEISPKNSKSNDYDGWKYDIESHSMTFTPLEPWRKSTRYLIKIPDKILLNNSTEIITEAKELDFTTQTLKVVKSFHEPSSGHLYNTHSTVFIGFNQRVSPQELLPFIRVNGLLIQNSDLLIIHQEIMKKDAFLKDMVSQYEDMNIGITSQQGFRADAIIEIDVLEGAPSLEGPLKSLFKHRITFKTHPFLLGQGSLSSSSLSTFVIIFNSDIVDLNGWEPTFSPKLPSGKWVLEGSRSLKYHPDGDIKQLPGSTEYQVNFISNDTQKLPIDINGERLQSEQFQLQTTLNNIRSICICDGISVLLSNNEQYQLLSPFTTYIIIYCNQMTSYSDIKSIISLKDTSITKLGSYNLKSLEWNEFPHKDLLKSQIPSIYDSVSLEIDKLIILKPVDKLDWKSKFIFKLDGQLASGEGSLKSSAIKYQINFETIPKQLVTFSSDIKSESSNVFQLHFTQPLILDHQLNGYQEFIHTMPMVTPQIDGGHWVALKSNLLEFVIPDNSNWETCENYQITLHGVTSIYGDVIENQIFEYTFNPTIEFLYPSNGAVLSRNQIFTVILKERLKSTDKILELFEVVHKWSTLDCHVLSSVDLKYAEDLKNRIKPWYLKNNGEKLDLDRKIVHFQCTKPIPVGQLEIRYKKIKDLPYEFTVEEFKVESTFPEDHDPFGQGTDQDPFTKVIRFNKALKTESSNQIVDSVTLLHFLEESNYQIEKQPGEAIQWNDYIQIKPKPKEIIQWEASGHFLKFTETNIQQRWNLSTNYQISLSKSIESEFGESLEHQLSETHSTAVNQLSFIYPHKNSIVTIDNCKYFVLSFSQALNISQLEKLIKIRVLNQFTQKKTTLQKLEISQNRPDDFFNSIPELATNQNLIQDRTFYLKSPVITESSKIFIEFDSIPSLEGPLLNENKEKLEFQIIGNIKIQILVCQYIEKPHDRIELLVNDIDGYPIHCQPVLSPVVPETTIQWSIDRETLKIIGKPSSGRLPYSTRFKLDFPDNVEIDGQREFSTPSIKILKSQPEADSKSINLALPISIQFNQLINKDSLLKKLTIHYVESRQQSKKNKHQIIDIKFLDNNWVEFILKPEILPNSLYIITIQKDLKSDEGLLKLDQPLYLHFESNVFKPMVYVTDDQYIFIDFNSSLKQYKPEINNNNNNNNNNDNVNEHSINIIVKPDPGVTLEWVLSNDKSRIRCVNPIQAWRPSIEYQLELPKDILEFFNNCFNPTDLTENLKLTTPLNRVVNLARKSNTVTRTITGIHYLEFAFSVIPSTILPLIKIYTKSLFKKTFYQVQLLTKDEINMELENPHKLETTYSYRQLHELLQSNPYIDDQTPTKVICYRLVDKVPYETLIHLKVNNLPCHEGTVINEIAYRSHLSYYEPFRVTSKLDGQILTEQKFIAIEFNRVILARSVEPSLITVQPNIPYRIGIQNNKLIIYDIRSDEFINQPYDLNVKLSRDILCCHGQNLTSASGELNGPDLDFTVTIQPFKSFRYSLKFDTSMQNSTVFWNFKYHPEPYIIMKSKNISQYGIQVYRLDPFTDYPRFINEKVDLKQYHKVIDCSKVQSNFNPLIPVGQLIFQDVVNIPIHLKNLSNEVEYKLKIPGLTIDDKFFGHLGIIVYPTLQSLYPNSKPSHPVFGRTWYQFSNMSVGAVGDKKSLTVWSSDINDGRMLPDCKVSIFSTRQLQDSPMIKSSHTTDRNHLVQTLKKANILQDGVTNEQGLLEKISTPLNPKEVYSLRHVIVENTQNGDCCLIPQANISPNEESTQLVWHVFDDQAIYRPKSKVEIKGYLKLLHKESEQPRVIYNLSPNTKIYYKFSDPIGSELIKGETTINAFSAFHISLQIVETIQLGQCSVELSLEDQDIIVTNDRHIKLKVIPNEKTYHHRFSVDAFNRSQYYIESKILSNNINYQYYGSAVIQLLSKYYEGGDLSGFNVQWKVTSKYFQFKPTKFNFYQFGILIKSSIDTTHNIDNNEILCEREKLLVYNKSKSLNTKSDQDGKSLLKLLFNGQKSLSVPLLINIGVNVYDISNQTQSSTLNFILHPSRFYIGLKTISSHMVVRECHSLTYPVNIDLVCVDITSNYCPDQELKIEVLEKNSVSEESKLVYQSKSISKNGPFSSTIQIEVPKYPPFSTKPNTYRIEVSTFDEQGNQSKSESEITISWELSKFAPQMNSLTHPYYRDSLQRNTNQHLEMKMDRVVYNHGDIATIEILNYQESISFSGVLNILNGGIQATRPFHIQDRFHDKIQLEIDQDWGTNVEIQCDIWNGESMVTAMASSSFNINNQRNSLQVEIQPIDNIMEPGANSNVIVKVLDDNSNPVLNAEVCLVIVDESQLALTGYQFLNPYETFFHKNPLKYHYYYLKSNMYFLTPDQAYTEPLKPWGIRPPRFDHDINRNFILRPNNKKLYSQPEKNSYVAKITDVPSLLPINVDSSSSSSSSPKYENSEIVDEYLRDADALVLLYSMDSLESYYASFEYYNRALNLRAVDYIPTVLIGTKSDLFSDAKDSPIPRSILYKQSMFAGFGIMDVSAKLNADSVDEAFDLLATIIPLSDCGKFIEICICGDKGVGKTSFLYRYLYKLFPANEHLGALIDVQMRKEIHIKRSPPQFYRFETTLGECGLGDFSLFGGSSSGKKSYNSIAMCAMSDEPSHNARRLKSKDKPKKSWSNITSTGDRNEETTDVSKPDINLFKIRSNFVALANFTASIATNELGIVNIPIQLPDNLTTYRVVAIANHHHQNASTGNQRFGKAECAIVATVPLSVRCNPPRFLNLYDCTQLNIVVSSKSDKKFNILVRTTDNLIIQPNSSHLFTRLSCLIEAKKRKLFSLPLKAIDLGNATIQIIVTNDDKINDFLQIEIPILQPPTLMTPSIYGSLDEPMMQPVQVPLDSIRDLGHLQIEISSTILSSLSECYIYIYQYQFDKTENLSSKAIGLSTMFHILKDNTTGSHSSLPSKSQVKSLLQKIIREIKSRQLTDGKFQTWSGSSNKNLNPFESIYCIHSLIVLRDNGYQIDERILSKSNSFLREFIDCNFQLSDELITTTCSFAIYTLYHLSSKRQKPEISSMAIKFLSTHSYCTLSLESLAWILGSLCDDIKYQKPRFEISEYLLKHAIKDDQKVYFPSYYKKSISTQLFHNLERTAAIILRSLVSVQSTHPYIPLIVLFLLDKKESDIRQNIQSDAWTILAICDYYKNVESQDMNCNAHSWLTNNESQSPLYLGKTPKFNSNTPASYSCIIPNRYLNTIVGVSDDDDDDDDNTSQCSKVFIYKEGKGKLYYRLSINYSLINFNTPSKNNGFELSRKYTTFNVTDKESLTVQGDGHILSIKVGTKITVTLLVTISVPRFNCVLIDRLPGGFETVDKNLVEHSILAEHFNLHDDRTEVFSSALPIGTYQFQYTVVASHKGDYLIPPVTIEEMYDIEVNAKSISQKISIN